MGLITRVVLAAVFFIIGFNFSYSSFFKENPLYGVPFLAEVVISLVSAAIGFYIIPIFFERAKYWIETLIINTVYEIVSNFWDQQAKNISQRKRAKQKQKSEEEKKRLKKQLEDSIVVDTSVLVDGRIVDIISAGFLSRTLVVTKAVLNELHLIADNKDSLKRQKGRRGLDTVKKLKDHTKVVFPDIKSKEAEVDKILVSFAKNNKLPLMTLDFNLNKRSVAEGIKVLNINDLVNAVKAPFLPGEELEVEIVQAGKEKEQGVGYMPDGTMVVVEDAKSLLGKKIKVKVARVIQSSAGKIVFASLLG